MNKNINNEKYKVLILFSHCQITEKWDDCSIKTILYKNEENKYLSW